MKRNGLRLLSALLALVMALVLLPVTAQAEDGVVEIGNYAELKTFAARVNGGEHGLSAKLTADITCTDKTWTPIGLSGHTYQGKFNGQGHSITGLSNADMPYSGYVVAIGLFGDVGGSAVIQNVAVKNCDLTFDPDSSDAMVYAGAIAAANGGTVENCYCTGTVRVASEEAFVGGIVGGNSGTVQNCYNTGTVGAACTDRHGNVYVGGVVGQNSDSGTVKNCYNTGTVNAESKVDRAQVYGGGVVGYHDGETVQDCHNTGAVSGSGEHSHVGGVVGYSYKKVQDCYNTGAVSGSHCETVGGVVGYTKSTVQTCLNTGAVSDSGDDTYVGGIAGSNSYGSVENCLNTGEISGAGTNAAGMVGENFGGAVKYCLSVGTVSGTARGGVVGFSPNSTSVTSYVENCYYLDTAASAAIGSVGTATVTNVSALTAEQLKSLSNCVGFSTDTWYEGLFYPVLKEFSAEIHLYANSNEDVVIVSYLCACTPTKIANPFTYEGHVFTGWNTQADGDGDSYDETHAFTLLPGETLALYAQWKDATYTITFQNEDGTELQSGPVAAGKTPVYAGETPTKAPTVEHLYTFAGWKLLGTETVLTELPAVDGEATYVAAYTESDRVYTGPEWAWDGYETATATFTAADDTTFTQVLTATGSAITHMTTVEPDCEYPGIVTYTAKVTFLGKDYYNDKTKEIAKRDHIWVFDEFVWTEGADGIYSVVANFHCERYASHKLEFIPVAGMAEDPATCTEDGCTHYVAFINAEESPDGAYHEDKLDIVIPAHGHQWSMPDYERIETETGYDVYAIVRCLYDYSHRIEETVHAVYEVITPPTLETEGLGQYTATFTDEHIGGIRWEVVIPKLRTTFCGADVNALDVCAWEVGETLYRYDIRVKHLENGTRDVNSMQIFLRYDHAILALAKSEGVVDWMINDTEAALSAVWASESDVTIADDEIVLTLWFKKIGDAAADAPVTICFVENALGTGSALSYVEDGTVIDYEVDTEDGSILFEAPLLGDANLDGQITAADAALVLRALVGLSELSTRGVLNADVDGDREITAADAAAILRYVVGLIETLPV